MGDPLGSPRVALLFAPERPKPPPLTSEAMVFGPGIRSDRCAVSLVGLGERFPDWGRNRDSEMVRDSYVGFAATHARDAMCNWETNDARKTSAITPALKHRIPSELRT